jgi:hypothetical protein
MNTIFANTGVQILFYRIERSDLGAVVPEGWHPCQVKRGQGVEPYRFIQWRYEDSPARMFLAVDTTCGDREIGHFSGADSLVEHRPYNLDGLLGVNGANVLDIGRRLDDEGKPAGEPHWFEIRARGDGEPRDVHLAIDFGNSRTGALLLEVWGGVDRKQDMLPLDLLNRHRLDAWDERGNPVKRADSRWFTSQTHWCTTPYLRPDPVRVIRREKKPVKRFGIPYEVIEEYEVVLEPALFDDLSVARMGREVVDVTNAIRGEHRPTTGVSSPKRYLWADDSHWLQGANWHMADPYDRYNRDRTHVAQLQGPLLRYFDQLDPDDVINPSWDGKGAYVEAPPMPRYAPRILMTAALYELISQAYSAVNSITYRRSMGDVGRLRRLASVSLSYPSGMIAPERARFLAQAQKAARVFDFSLGKAQERPLHVSLSVDEASAVHLTYIWSEIQLIDNLPELWFEVVGRRRLAADAEGTAENLPGEVRIACIDIGGGTTDLMIASYSFEGHAAIDRIRGVVLHRDGVSLAGDHLIKRLLEQIIVPEFGRAFGLDHPRLQLLFGPESRNNLEFRPQRIDWINRFFVPLAVAYLERASTGSTEPIFHSDPQIVQAEVLESLQKQIDRLYGFGQFEVHNEFRLVYDPFAFKELVGSVFRNLLYDFCGRIVKHDADIVLLAGQPTKLLPIQEMVQKHLPLTSSRIIPMHNYYAGTRYPYQDEKGRDPGRIVDPKSAVVVGTAIHHLARRGMLSKLKFELDDPIRTESYFWGVMNDRNLRFTDRNVLFRSDARRASQETEVPVENERLMIGRRLSPSESAQPSPVYQLRLGGDGEGEIKVKVRLARYVDPTSKEELLRLVSASGTIRGEKAVAGQNVRLDLVTLAHERYYLDNGGLDNIAEL